MDLAFFFFAQGMSLREVVEDQVDHLFGRRRTTIFGNDDLLMKIVY